MTKKLIISQHAIVRWNERIGRTVIGTLEEEFYRARKVNRKLLKMYRIQPMADIKYYISHMCVFVVLLKRDGVRVIKTLFSSREAGTRWDDIRRVML